VIKEVEVIKEVPVEIIKEVEVVKQIDMNMLKQMMANMGTVEESRQVIGETRTQGESKIVERREVTEIRQPDDLKKVEGIGPKIEGLLNKAGILTWRQLSNTAVSDIKAILEAAGKRYQMHDPTTWPQQAGMAADGKWEELKKWQDELDGGR